MSQIPLPEWLRDETGQMIDILSKKGRDAAQSKLMHLRKALDSRSRCLYDYAMSAVKTAHAGDGDVPLTDHERRIIGNTLNALEAWQKGKPGPAKQYPHQINLRVDDEVESKLESIKAATGETHSDIVRRLILAKPV